MHRMTLNPTDRIGECDYHYSPLHGKMSIRDKQRYDAHKNHSSLQLKKVVNK